MTSRLTRVTMIFALALLAGGTPTTAQSKDPFVGSWRLNVARARTVPARPPRARSAPTRRLVKDTKCP